MLNPGKFELVLHHMANTLEAAARVEETYQQFIGSGVAIANEFIKSEDTKMLQAAMRGLGSTLEKTMAAIAEARQKRSDIAGVC